ALVRQMLWRAAQNGKGVNMGVFTNLGMTFNHDMRLQLYTIPKRYLRPDDRPRPDAYITPQPGRRINYGRRLENRRSLTHFGASTTMAENSASQTTLPLTR